MGFVFQLRDLLNFVALTLAARPPSATLLLDLINLLFLGQQKEIHPSSRLRFQPQPFLCDDGSLTQHHLYSSGPADVVVPALIL